MGSIAGDLFYVTEQTGSADIYHRQADPYTRRLISDPAGDTAPAWNPWVLVAPPALRSTPSPPATPTPRPPAPTLAPTRAATPTAAASVPGPPVMAGTPIPAPLPPISPENASSLVEVAHWGGGDTTQVAYAPQGRLVAVAARDGIYLYDGQTLEPVRYARTEVGVQQLAFSPDGQTLASGSADNTVRLWAVGECLQQAEGCGRLLHTVEAGAANSVAFSFDGTLLASDAPWVIQLWGAACHTVQDLDSPSSTPQMDAGQPASGCAPALAKSNLSPPGRH